MGAATFALGLPMSESKPVFVDMPAGNFVFREGDAGSDMYIIESGTLPEGDVDWLRSHIPRLMAGVADLKVPLLAEVGVGPNWDKAH